MLCQVALAELRNECWNDAVIVLTSSKRRPEQYHHARPSMHHWSALTIADWMHPDRCNTSINFQTNNTHRLPHNRAYSCTNPSCLSRPCTFVRLSRWWSVLDRNNMLRPHYYTTVAMWMVRVPTDPLLDSNVKCERLGVATNDLPSVSHLVNQNMPPTHWLIVVRRHSSQSCRSTLCWNGINNAQYRTVRLSSPLLFSSLIPRLPMQLLLVHAVVDRYTMSLVMSCRHSNTQALCDSSPL